MAVSTADMRVIVERVCARPDVLEACVKRDLGAVVAALGSAGITQGRIAALTGVSQGRLSGWMTGKREPKAVSTFQKFADGVGLPNAARRALGLAPTNTAPADTNASTDEIRLSYPDGSSQAAENVSVLWRVELADPSAFQHGRFDPRLWGDASLRWLVDPGRVPDERASGVRIGMGDVTRFRTTVDLFADLDNRFGGGHARESLIKYLSVDAERLLRGRYSANVGRELFSAVGEATLLAAWMTYDSAPTSPLAQSYFVQALALAQAGNDRLLGASRTGATTRSSRCSRTPASGSPS